MQTNCKTLYSNTENIHNLLIIKKNKVNIENKIRITY